MSDCNGVRGTMGQEQLKDLREGNRLEAKLAKGGVPASVWETYSAFANTEGGTIMLGVRETADGSLEVEGLADPEGLCKKFWDGVNNPSKVSANLLTNEDVSLVEAEGKTYLRINVPRAPRQLKPVYVSGDQARGTYRRNGEGDYHCSADEIVAMVRDASPSPLDALVLENFGLEAQDMDSVERFRATMEAVRPGHPWNKLGAEDLLLKLNAAGRVEGEGALHPTRAGLLMFGYEYEIVREYPEYFLDYREMGDGARWRDRVVSNDGTWSGGLFDFWSKVVPRLTAGVKRPFALSESLQRVEDTEMHAAVREAFVNSLVHSDYYGRRGVAALRYPDRIKIENPGSLRIALDVMLAGGVSDARNPTLMKMFGLINACEKAGSGFDVMRRAAVDAQAPLPAAVESFSPDRIAVTVYLGNAAADQAYGPNFAEAATSGPKPQMRPADESSASKKQEDFSTYPEEERAVLRMASERGEFNRRDVEQLLACGSTKAKAIVGALLEKGAISSKGASRSTRYTLSGE